MQVRLNFYIAIHIRVLIMVLGIEIDDCTSYVWPRANLSGGYLRRIA